MEKKDKPTLAMRLVTKGENGYLEAHEIVAKDIANTDDLRVTNTKNLNGVIYNAKDLKREWIEFLDAVLKRLRDNDNCEVCEILH